MSDISRYVPDIPDRLTLPPLCTLSAAPRFDCGSGVGTVRSTETVKLNEWNTLSVYRHRWDAWIQLNQEKRVEGRSKVRALHFISIKARRDPDIICLSHPLLSLSLSPRICIYTAREGFNERIDIPRRDVLSGLLVSLFEFPRFLERERRWRALTLSLSLASLPRDFLTSCFM